MALLLALTAKEKLEGAMVLSGYLPLLNDSRLVSLVAEWTARGAQSCFADRCLR
mgnify:CR=1 FL=1